MLKFGAVAVGTQQLTLHALSFDFSASPQADPDSWEVNLCGQSWWVGTIPSLEAVRDTAMQDCAPTLQIASQQLTMLNGFQPQMGHLPACSACWSLAGFAPKNLPCP